MGSSYLGMLALFAGEFLREIIASFGLANFGPRFDFLNLGIVALMCLSGPILGTLSDVFGRTRVLRWSLLGLSGASLLFFVLDLDTYFGAPLNIDCLLLGAFFGVRSVAFAAILDGTNRTHCARAVVKALLITGVVWVVFALAEMSAPSLVSKSHYLLVLGIGAVLLAMTLEWAAPIGPHSSHLEHALSTPPGAILLWKRRDLGAIVLTLLVCQLGWWSADVYLFSSGSPGIRLADALLYQAGVLVFAGWLMRLRRPRAPEPRQQANPERITPEPQRQLLLGFVSTGIPFCLACCLSLVALSPLPALQQGLGHWMVALLSFGSGLYVPAIWILCLSRARWTWHGRICGILDGTMLLAETLAVWSTAQIGAPDRVDFVWLLGWFALGFTVWTYFKPRLLAE